MEQQPAILSAVDLRIEVVGKVLLDGGAFAIQERERVGLVGRNGSGKSTLLKVLAGRHPPHGGTITRRKALSTSYLPQEVQLVPDKTVRENILAGAADTIRLLQRYESTAPDSREHTELEAILTARDAWSLDRRVEHLATWLATPPLDRQAGTLSGGESRRVGLCQALIGQPDLLLLDEPTNHLDTPSIEWLEDYLRRYSGTVFFVTHDRYFLDRIAGRMFELDRGSLYRYDGNYSAYLRGKAAREEEALVEDQKRRQFLRREIEWIRRSPKARTTKSQSRVQRFEAVAAQDAYVRDPDVDLVIPAAGRLAGRVLDLHGVGLRRGGRWLFRHLDLNLKAGQRLGVIGPNGAGKTSLLQLMLGKLIPDEGHVTVGARTVFNLTDQHRQLLDGSKTVFEEVGEGKDVVQLGDERLSLWTYLKRYLFTDEEIRTPVGILSGGERNRVLLAKVLKYGGNVLLLDEPTNDLDLSTLRILEEALSTFAGTVVAVSHDRYFLNRICTAILAFEGDGQVAYQEGDYDYYAERRDERLKATAGAAATAAPPPPPPPAVPPQARKLTWKEARELEQIEARILEAETVVERLEGLFSSPDFYGKHGAQATALIRELEEARAQVATLYDRWQTLEAIRAEA